MIICKLRVMDVRAYFCINDTIKEEIQEIKQREVERKRNRNQYEDVCKSIGVPETKEQMDQLCSSFEKRHAFLRNDQEQKEEDDKLKKKYAEYQQSEQEIQENKQKIQEMEKNKKRQRNELYDMISASKRRNVSVSSSSSSSGSSETVDDSETVDGVVIRAVKDVRGNNIDMCVENGVLFLKQTINSFECEPSDSILTFDHMIVSLAGFNMCYKGDKHKRTPLASNQFNFHVTPDMFLNFQQDVFINDQRVHGVFSGNKDSYNKKQTRIDKLMNLKKNRMCIFNRYTETKSEDCLFALFENVFQIPRNRYFNVNWFHNDFTCNRILDDVGMGQMKKIQCRFIKQWIIKLKPNREIYMTLHDTTMKIKKTIHGVHCHLTKENCSNNFEKGTVWNVQDVYNWMNHGKIPSCTGCDAPYLTYQIDKNKYKCWSCDKWFDHGIRYHQKHVDEVFILNT